MDKKEFLAYRLKYKTLNYKQKIELSQRLCQDIEHLQNRIQEKKQLINELQIQLM